MSLPLAKALIALLAAGILFAGSALLFVRAKGLSSLLQLAGAGCLVGVVLTHIAEGLRVFPWMNWGLEDSVGHYLDFWSAVLGFTLFPIGYLLHAVQSRPAGGSGKGIGTAKNAA
jgi:hypothetical protein